MEKHLGTHHGFNHAFKQPLKPYKMDLIQECKMK